MEASSSSSAQSRATMRFTSLFEESYSSVLAYVMRRAQRDMVDDVVADTFLTAWRRLEEIPPDALPWLLGVARRILANARRSERRRGALVLRLASQPKALDPDPAGAVVKDSALVAALAALREKDREILMLVAWEGLDADRAGRVLRCSAEAAAVRLHRARRRLAQALAKQEQALVQDFQIDTSEEIR